MSEEDIDEEIEEKTIELGEGAEIDEDEEEHISDLPRTVEFSRNVCNWFVIYPYKDLEMVKKVYEELNLLQFTTSVIIINDDLSEQQELIYISFVNRVLKYNGHVASSSSDEKYLMQTIEDMGGCDGDELYIFKKGKLVHKKVDLTIL